MNTMLIDSYIEYDKYKNLGWGVYCITGMAKALDRDGNLKEALKQLERLIGARLFMRNGTESAFTNLFTIRYGNPETPLKPIMVKKPYLQDGKA